MFWVLLFVLWPLAELFAIVKVTEAIGFVPMLILLLIGVPIGILVLRRQGRFALQRFAGALQRGRAPAHEVVDGVLMLAGGLLLVVPGFLTDVVGIVLLVPVARGPMRWLTLRYLGGSRLWWAVRFGGIRRRPAYDADATAFDIDRPELTP